MSNRTLRRYGQELKAKKKRTMKRTVQECKYT
jgi:hypothetical protein